MKEKIKKVEEKKAEDHDVYSDGTRAKGEKGKPGIMVIVPADNTKPDTVIHKKKKI